MLSVARQGPVEHGETEGRIAAMAAVERSPMQIGEGFIPSPIRESDRDSDRSITARNHYRGKTGHLLGLISGRRRISILCIRSYWRNTGTTWAKAIVP